MNEHEDTYFFSRDEALQVATRQNRFDNDEKLQACYYDGEKIESDLVNLIHLPVDNLVEDLARGRFRLPTKVDLNGLELSSRVKIDITTNFNMSLFKVREYRNQYNQGYLKSLKTAILDFNEPLRFYLSASVTTQVMRYVSKDIANILEEAGHEVMYDLYLGIEDVSCLKNINQFNPHVTININHLNNSYLNDECFNFVWFQDPMPVMYNSDKIHLRERDFIFSYTTLFTKLLINKGVDKNQIFKQYVFPVDTKSFFNNENIERSRKIVFVGSFYQPSSYSKHVNKDIDMELRQVLESGNMLSFETLKSIFNKHNVYIDSDEESVYFNLIQQGYNRNISVEWLCEKHEIDLYGYNWEICLNENIRKNFKGSIEKAKLNNLYNSAKYVLAASGQVINTQRLGEMAHAGAIPVIYDSRGLTDEDETWEDECLYFKTKEELEYILDNNIKPKKYMSKRMLEYFTYDNFFKIIFEQINIKLTK